MLRGEKQITRRTAVPKRSGHNTHGPIGFQVIRMKNYLTFANPSNWAMSSARRNNAIVSSEILNGDGSSCR